MGKNKAFSYLALLFMSCTICTGCSMKEISSTPTLSVAAEIDEYNYKTSSVSVGNVVYSKKEMLESLGITDHKVKITLQENSILIEKP